MSRPATYQIVLRGRVGAALLRPLLDDFTVDRDDRGTRLVGEVRDPSHLNGVLMHLTSLNAELISVTQTGTTHPTAARPNAR